MSTEEDQAKPARKSSEERNAEARAALEPLAKGERPGAVTVAAVIAGLLGLSTLVLYFAGVETDTEVSLAGTLAFSGVMLLASVGMFMSKYWAVLGFQVILGLSLVISGLSLIVAQNLAGFIFALTMSLGSGLLFWKLVKAMARIQMPSSHREDKVGSE